MPKKETTINDLAIMVQKGFESTDTKIDSLETRLNKRFDKLENLILTDHRQRIERLEMQVEDIRGLLATK